MGDIKEVDQDRQLRSGVTEEMPSSGAIPDRPAKRAPGVEEAGMKMGLEFVERVQRQS